MEIIVNQQGGLYFDRDGSLYNCHDEHDPIECARKKMAGQQGIIFLFGIGLGFEWMSLLEQLDEDSYVVAIEPAASYDILHKSDLWTIIYEVLELYQTRTIIIPGASLAEKDFHALIPWMKVNEVSVVATTGYDKAFADEYKQLLIKVKKEMHLKLVDQNTILYHLTMWQENFIKNIHFVINSLCFVDFCGIFDVPIPGIVVSAGPSLDKNIHVLKEMEGKAFIITGYTAYKALKKHGITADLLVAFDGEQLNKEKEFFPVDIPLGFYSLVEPALVERCSPHLFMPTEIDPVSNYLQMKNIQTGGSVSCSMLDILRLLHCDPIIFVGQDMALSGDRSHASGTDYDGETCEVDEAYMKMVPGFNGLVKSTRALYSFLLWFEKYIRHNQTISFIDATEGGAIIHGASVKTLSELSRTLPDIADAKAVFHQKIQACEELKLSKGGYLQKPLENLLIEGRKEIEMFLPLWAEGMELIQSIQENYGDQQAAFRRLDEIDAQYTAWKAARFLLELPLHKIQYDMVAERKKTKDVLCENMILYEGLYHAGIKTLQLLDESCVPV